MEHRIQPIRTSSGRAADLAGLDHPREPAQGALNTSGERRTHQSEPQATDTTYLHRLAEPNPRAWLASPYSV